MRLPLVHCTLPSSLNKVESSSRDFAHKLVRARFCDVFTRSRANALSSVKLFLFVASDRKTQRTAASLAKQHLP
jgi:hypothetical protein